MQIRCIIVEDEPLAQARLREFVGKIPYLECKDVFASGLEAMLFLQANQVDLVFVDINIHDISGIQVLESLKVKPEVIIITAYDQYAVKGFELQVTDYLLKPYTLERFVQAAEKARENLQKRQGGEERKSIFIRTEYRLERVALEDILYIEGMRDYRRVCTADRKIMTLQTFRELEDEIPPSILCRVHRSYMVNIGKIDSIERDEILIGGVSIPISEGYKKELLRIIGR